MKAPSGTDTHREALSDSVSHMLEECRMVLPGIQALFGFQLIAVFNSTFWTKLDRLEQVLHYLAIGLVACSVALVMTPAAYHRQAEPMTISRRFLTVSTRLLFWSMYPLMGAILLDFYLIGSLILDDRLFSLIVTLVLWVVFLILWVFLPRARKLQHILGGPE
ncbi:MAG TPA: DUF6328 family protein [Nitrospira sp.]|nr:DUF6328 family protein [Nitrospira sp.]